MKPKEVAGIPPSISSDEVVRAVDAENQVASAKYEVRGGIIFHMSPGAEYPVGPSWAMTEEEVEAEYT